MKIVTWGRDRHLWSGSMPQQKEKEKGLKLKGEDQVCSFWLSKKTSFSILESKRNEIKITQFSAVMPGAS